MTNKEKILMLHTMYRFHGDFYIWNSGFETWVYYSKSSTNQKLLSKHRSIFNDEIILDIEEPERLKEVVTKLEKNKYNFNIWDTGSRGFHISIIFPELLYFDEKTRKYIRKFFIEKYDCDLMKMNGMIALENEEHWKGTGKIKSLLYSSNKSPVNKLKKSIIKKASNYVEDSKRWESVKMTDITKEWIKQNPYIRFLLENKIPDGTSRYRVVCKNVGIALGRSEATNKEIIPIVNQIAINMPGRERKDFWGWIKASRQGRFTQFNEHEMYNWMFGLDDETRKRFFNFYYSRNKSKSLAPGNSEQLEVKG